MDRGCRIDALLMDYNERVIREGFVSIENTGDGIGIVRVLDVLVM